MAYSIDFRKRAIEYMEEGHTGKELYEAFKIWPSSVLRWKELLERTGSLNPEYRETRKRKIDLDELERAIERKPDATLSELGRLFDCTKQAIDAALKRLKITLKKNIYLLRKTNNRCDFIPPSICLDCRYHEGIQVCFCR